MRAAALLGVLICGACTSMPDVVDSGVDAAVEVVDAAVDAGERDPGFDIPPSEWVDGGLGDAWGCWGQSNDRFIVFMDTTNGNDPWCAAIEFRRQDGGFTPLFPEFDAPEDFQVADARWQLICPVELPEGGIDHTGTRPVHDLYGGLTFRAFFMGRPRGMNIDAGIRVAYRVYGVRRGAGITETCAGP